MRGVLRGQGRIYSRPFGKGVRQVGFKGADEKGRARKQYCLTGIDAADDAMDVDVDEIKYYDCCGDGRFVARRPTFFLRTQIILPNMYLRKL